MFMRKKKGQSILEYAVFLAVLIAVIIIMQIYVKRAIQGKFKSTADQISDQFSTGQYNTLQTITQTARSEDYQAGNATGGVVSKSEIAGDAAWAGNLSTQGYACITAKYAGAELSSTDYVNTTPGKSVGAHDVYQSGVLKNLTLFGDDEAIE